MTPSPYSIGAQETLVQAGAAMREHGVRHLPVVYDGRLVGIVTDRDVRFLELLNDVDPRLVTVSDAMAQIVYAVTPDAPLDEVVQEMGSRKCDAAVVMQDDHVVGMFTTVDVCRVLAAVLRLAL
jgi:acetoin utilization protein AcuB